MKESKSVYVLIEEKPGRYTGTKMQLEELWELIGELRNYLNKENHYWRGPAEDAVVSRDADCLWLITACMMHPEIEDMVGERTISEDEMEEILDKLITEDCDEEENIKEEE